jgi:hypothetical protein
VDPHVPKREASSVAAREESEPVLLARFEDVRALLGPTVSTAAADVSFFVGKLALRGLVGCGGHRCPPFRRRAASNGAGRTK